VALSALEAYQQIPREFYPLNSKYGAFLRGEIELSEQEERGVALCLSAGPLQSHRFPVAGRVLEVAGAPAGFAESLTYSHAETGHTQLYMRIIGLPRCITGGSSMTLNPCCS
jgi:hypothetical protein